MCHLNIICKTKNKDISGFIQSVTATSYLRNNDGDGCFLSDGTLIKSKLKQNITDYKNNVKDSNFILCHQRMATSGLTEEYTQPFENDDFVFMHNGVISDYDKRNNISDTFNLFETFKSIFEMTKGKKRETNITDTIKMVFDKLSGSWSICLYDKKKNCIYYFKNNGTFIFCHYAKDFMFMTTSAENDLFLTMLPTKTQELKIEPFTIYKADIYQKKIRFLKIGEIKESIILYSFNKQKKKHKNKKVQKKQKNKSIELIDMGKEFGVQNLEIRTTQKPCLYCETATFNLWREKSERVCDDCLSENIMYEELISLKLYNEKMKERENVRESYYFNERDYVNGDFNDDV